MPFVAAWSHKAVLWHGTVHLNSKAVTIGRRSFHCKWSICGNRLLQLHASVCTDMIAHCVTTTHVCKMPSLAVESHDSGRFGTVFGFEIQCVYVELWPNSCIASDCRTVQFAATCSIEMKITSRRQGQMKCNFLHWILLEMRFKFMFSKFNVSLLYDCQVLQFETILTHRFFFIARWCQVPTCQPTYRHIYLLARTIWLPTYWHA